MFLSGVWLDFYEALKATVQMEHGEVRQTTDCDMAVLANESLKFNLRYAVRGLSGHLMKILDSKQFGNVPNAIR